MQFIKENLSVKPGTISISVSNLEKVTNRCIILFLKSNESKNLIMALHRDSYEKDSEFNLRSQSVCEVFDFLQMKSSRILLETIVYFSIFKAVMKLLSKKIDILFGYSELSVKPVKSELIGIIIHTPWLKALSHLNSLNKCEQNTDKERSTSRDRFRDREYSIYRQRRQRLLMKVKIC